MLLITLEEGRSVSLLQKARLDTQEEDVMSPLSQ